MVKVRVKVIGSGKEGDPFRVNLPTYVPIPGTEEYADPKKRIPKTVLVEMPDDECTEGRPDKAKIRAKYKGQPLWDRDDVLSDI